MPEEAAPRRPCGTGEGRSPALKVRFAAILTQPGAETSTRASMGISLPPRARHGSFTSITSMHSPMICKTFVVSRA